MKKLNQKSLIYKTLEYLKDTSINLLDLSFVIMFDPDELIRQGGFIPKNYSLPSLLYKKIYNLKKSSYFEYKNNKIYLTSKGRIEIIKRIIKDKKENKKWDGKWWAIIFDIPELNRKERSFLRRELKLIDLKELQHSVWVTPYNIEKELLALLKLWKKDFKGDIRFLKIEKITEDKDIKKKFNL